jgi:hypothetical protein
MATSHRMKYEYDQAREILFDRALPHMNGQAWAAFQKGVSARCQQPKTESNADQSGAHEPSGDPPALLDPSETLSLQETEHQLHLKIADLESRIHSLNRIQKEPPARIWRRIAGLMKKTGVFCRQQPEKGVDRS